MIQAIRRARARAAAGMVLFLAGAAAGQTQTVTDPSFETSGPAFPSPGPWAQFSQLFDTPLCNGATCLGGQPTAARTGDWWAWFGGSDSAAEHATLTQSITLPAGTATLQFYLVGYTSRTVNPGTDWLRVSMDTTQVFSLTDAGLGPYTTDYQPVTIDVSGYTNGVHTLKFECMTQGGGFLTNFFVDDVTIAVVTPQSCFANCDGSTVQPILNVNDFICFQTKYAAGNPYANCDNSTTPPILNVNDFICFLTKFAQGCP